MTLTEDQRWLLAVYPADMLADLIVSPEYGLSRIKSTCAGGTAHRGGNKQPEWLQWYETGGGAIRGYSRAFLEPKVSLTYTQIARWAAEVPQDIRSKLEANRAERIAEATRASDWCFCPWKDEPPNAHSGKCERLHPEHDEVSRHDAAGLRIRAYGRVYVSQAIWRQEPAQLDLFGAAS